MSLICCVLSSKYIRSELFRHVSLIHKQLDITKVFSSSDIASLYHYVQCSDTAKFIHHCNQLDISVHSPQDLLSTIIDAFYLVLKKQNDRLVTYIIERFRRGSNTSEDQFVKFVRHSLFRHINYNSHLKLSRQMIDTLLSYLPDVAPSSIVQHMMRSALVEHSDLDLCVQMSPLDLSHPIGCAIDHYVTIGHTMKEFNPMFLQHQSRIIDDLHRYLESHKPEEYYLSTYKLVSFATKHRLYDLLMKIAKHVVHYENEEISLCLSPLEQSPISVGSLMELEINNPPLFNRLASAGDITFMKHVQHLMPKYLSRIIGGSPYQKLYDHQLLQCALSNNHYQCALYILDNITPVEQYSPGPADRWIVTGINMSNDHNWNDFIIKNHKWHFDFGKICLYSDAIRGRRLDVIEYLETGQFQKGRLFNFDRILNVALQEQFIDAIKTIIHNRPGHVYKNIKLCLIDQCASDIQDMFLASLQPGECIDFDNSMLTNPYKVAEISADTIRMMIKHKHHTYCLQSLLRSADLLNEQELVGILGSCGTSPYICDPWIVAKENISGISLFGVGLPEQMIHILLRERNRSRIDALLATPTHFSRAGATFGKLIGSDVMAFFNLLPPQPTFLLISSTYQADVSRLDIDLIDFIWSRLSDTLKCDQKFIIDVLSSNAAMNNITIIEDIHRFD
ncbi:hypothetical protein SAMD00019534_093000 [Acytostelium subglobosum LB1]|uniref:hypothetical protein n=1 Tax=Acytostelium subglobosum LB1 TaxID=1410327 RepID=UPI000644C14E|nr:hypothetical protein SAMD00019534_093000 [Acytostelium subglobosum LB1]GAM26125.1 hypothetical protein SAMD00019534_093000 [Acytostelium subglobosum LB1]|eukprot:XP_012751168.1 hypothetical protein SAMD00019534_093000 [Acytostelium subglobosum LB1]